MERPRKLVFGKTSYFKRGRGGGGGGGGGGGILDLPLYESVCLLCVSLDIFETVFPFSLVIDHVMGARIFARGASASL
jgi:hypothetical protein